jgi:hypothetical protein
MHRERAFPINRTSTLKYVSKMLRKVTSIPKLYCIALLAATTILLACGSVNSNGYTNSSPTTAPTKKITPTPEPINLDMGHTVGEKAQDFQITDTSMVTHSISDYINGSVILYFYTSW